MARKLKDKKNPNLKSWLVHKLRRASYSWPARSEALSRARVERGIYQCQLCLEQFRKKDVVLDHISPVVSVKNGWTNWDDFINRLFCQADGYQVLCNNCHDSKTKVENEMRKKFKEK